MVNELSCAWWRIGAVAALLSATACAPESATVTFKSLPPPDYYTASFGRDASHEQVEHEVRAHCAGKQFCKVFGWTDNTAVATALPMTDRELAAEVMDYSLNRETGLDAFKWLGAK